MKMIEHSEFAGQSTSFRGWVRVPGSADARAGDWGGSRQPLAIRRAWF